MSRSPRSGCYRRSIARVGNRVRHAACGMALVISARLTAQSTPPLPDSSGWGVHQLARVPAPDGSVWVGTYGQGIFVLRNGASSWQQIRASNDTAAHAISWDFVHAFGFGPRGEIWYGTVGSRCGLSADGSVWVGTYGQGIFVLRNVASSWQQIRASNDTAAHES